MATHMILPISNPRIEEKWKKFNPRKSTAAERMYSAEDRKMMGIADHSWQLQINVSDLDELAKRVGFTYSHMMNNKFELRIVNELTGKDRTFKYFNTNGNIDTWASKDVYMEPNIYLYIRK